VILQQQVNSVSTRHIQPDGHGSFDFVWTHFGFEDDTEEMTQRRLRQANLFGPAGFVSADDGEVIEFSQQAFESKPSAPHVAELGGTGTEDTEHMVTETLIRGMYAYWRHDERPRLRHHPDHVTTGRTTQRHVVGPRTRCWAGRNSLIYPVRS
jgi:salicylate 5-hydroxylase large subunit